MKPIMLLGVVLIVLGALALAYQGVTYTTREKVIDLGPLQASVDKKNTIPLPPVVGGPAVAAGISWWWSGTGPASAGSVLRGRLRP